VLTILAPEFAQESTIHFHYLLEQNGGFLSVASNLEEHLTQLARVLDEDTAASERRRRFVESFVRPYGLDRPATPIFADEVEELAALRVENPRRLSRILLRVPLVIEAALSVLAIPYYRRAKRARRSHRSTRLLRRRRLEARMRRLGPHGERLEA
jgi:hypothetical protein